MWSLLFRNLPHGTRRAVRYAFDWTVYGGNGDRIPLQVHSSRQPRWPDMGVKGFTLVLLTPFSFLPLWCLLTLMVFTYLFRCLTLFCEISTNINVNLNKSWCWKNIVAINGSRLQLDKLLDHVFDRAHAAHAKTKVVFQANGIPPCDSSMDLIITGEHPALSPRWKNRQVERIQFAFSSNANMYLHAFYCILQALPCWN